jgi:putative hydrolase
MISTGTDAHIATDVGRFDATAELLDYIHFPEELIATASAERFMSLVPCMRS